MATGNWGLKMNVNKQGVSQVLNRLSYLSTLSHIRSYSPIKVYDQVTSWQKPVKRVWDKQILDVTAIDNLPSLLPRESSEDFATQPLPNLMSLNEIETGVWEKAHAVFKEHIKDLK